MDKNTNDFPLRVRNYVNRDGCIYHSTYVRNGDDITNTPPKSTSIAAKLKYIGSVLTDKVVSSTTKWAGNAAEALVEPSSKNGNLAENYFSEYDNYSNGFDAIKNEKDITNCGENQLDDIDVKIAHLESIFIRINADLSTEPESIATQTENGCCEDGDYMCSGENCRHRMIIDEFPISLQDSNNIKLKPVPILGHILDSIAGSSSSVTNDKVDKDSNLRSTILKYENK